MKLALFLILTIFMLSACNKEGDRFQETVQIKADENIKAKNNDIEVWSGQLEGDLDRRRLFIDAVEGEFEGRFETKDMGFGIRFGISSSFPEYTPDRVRTLPELTHELNNLYLNIHVVQWPEDNPSAAIGCVFEGVRPDIKRGLVDLFSKGCSVSYKLRLGQGSATDINIASTLSSDILNSLEGPVQVLNGSFQTSTNANLFKFSIQRIK